MYQSNQIATGSVHGDQENVTRQIIDDISFTLAELPPALIVFFGAPFYDLEALNASVAARFPTSEVMGCSTAGELTECGDVQHSVVYFALGGDVIVQAGLGTNLQDNPASAVWNALEGIETERAGYRHRCAILLVDALAGRGEETVLAAAVALGSGFRLAGGAAGDDLQMKSTQVALGDQVVSDGVVIATVHSRRPIGLGVAHGHCPFTEPVTVTRSEGNVVYELDGRPAWEVWRDATRSMAAEQGVDLDTIELDDAGAVLLRYEAALEAGDAWKIRAPLSVSADGAIHFACGLPEGAVIRFTESSHDDQINSARAAARQAAAQVGGAPIAGALVFDCICRKLILGDEFAVAVQTMSEALGGVPIAGFETYGEIALEAGDLSGFHNTTTVVLAFA